MNSQALDLLTDKQKYRHPGGTKQMSKLLVLVINGARGCMRKEFINYMKNAYLHVDLDT